MKKLILLLAIILSLSLYFIWNEEFLNGSFAFMNNSNLDTSDSLDSMNDFALDLQDNRNKYEKYCLDLIIRHAKLMKKVKKGIQLGFIDYKDFCSLFELEPRIMNVSGGDVSVIGDKAFLTSYLKGSMKIRKTQWSKSADIALHGVLQENPVIRDFEMGTEFSHRVVDLRDFSKYEMRVLWRVCKLKSDAFLRMGISKEDVESRELSEIFLRHTKSGFFYRANIVFDRSDYLLKFTFLKVGNEFFVAENFY